MTPYCLFFSSDDFFGRALIFLDQMERSFDIKDEHWMHYEDFKNVLNVGIFESGRKISDLSAEDIRKFLELTKESKMLEFQEIKQIIIDERSNSNLG